MRGLPGTVLLFVLLLVASAGMQGCGQSDRSVQTPRTDGEAPLPPDAAKHFENGVRNLQDNKVADASEDFRQTVRLAPDAPAGHLWLGRVYLIDKKLPEAETELKKVLTLAPENYTAMILLGRLCSADPNRVDEAGDYLRQALKLSPDNVEAHFDLGRIYALKGDRQKSIEAFNFIFFKERDFHIYHYEVGRILEGWGEKSEALRQYNQALLFNANFAEAKEAVRRLTQAPPPSSAPAAPDPPKKDKKGKTRP